jgi:competence protein ComEC
MGLATVFALGSNRFAMVALTAIALVCILLMLVLSKQWVNRRRNHYFGLLATILFFSLAYVFGGLAMTRSSVELSSERSYVATIETVPVKKDRSYAVNLKLIASHFDSTCFYPFDARIVAYFHKESFDTTLVPGQCILFKGYFSPESKNLFPREFDYADYLKKKGYQGTAYIPEGGYQLVEYSDFSLKALLNGIRWRIIRKLKEYPADSREFGVIAALVLGDRSFLDADLRSDFATAGAVHILAVSGLHVGIIYLLFSGLFDLLFKKRAQIFKFLLILLILWTYAGLTGFSPSVLRAATMFSFISLGKYQKKYGSIYNMIAASALLLLIANPFLITQVGFQLSYLAVLGIVFYHPKFYQLLTFENWFLDKAWSLVCVSVAAQLATFPLSLYYFNQFPNLFLVTNLIVIPLATFILYSGVAWVSVIWLPMINDVFGWLTYQLTSVLNEFVGFINRVSFAKTDELFIDEIQVILIYLLMASVTVFVQRPSRQSLRWSLLMAIFLMASDMHHRYIARWSERLTILEYDDDLIAIRLIRGKAEVYSQVDLSEKREHFERRLTPYFLSRGVRSDCLIYHPSESDLEAKQKLRLESGKPIHYFEIRGDKVIFLGFQGVDSISFSDETFKELKIADFIQTEDDPLPRKR